MDDKSADTLAKALSSLNFKLFSAEKIKALEFTILNETAQIIPYDRAVLVDMRQSPYKVVGVSGQSSLPPHTPLADKWQRLMGSLSNPMRAAVLTENLFSRHQEIWHEVLKEQGGTAVFWLPIPVKGKTGFALWLERWNGALFQPKEIELLASLSGLFGLALSKFAPRLPQNIPYRQLTHALILGILISLVFIRIPLRIVASCEVVPNDPTVVTAPLDGIVAEMIVKPGTEVSPGDLLFEYDKRVPLQELKVAQKQVEITETELNRAKTEGIKDPQALAEMTLLELKLQKENLALELAEYYASRLSVTSPTKGVIMLDNPEEWRGRPVKVGQRVLIVSDPHNTKVRLWIAEDDNIVLNKELPVKVFLNVNPAKSYPAKLDYVADFTSVNEKRVRGFEAEALWFKQPLEVKLGLKGTAILYGNNVSLIYYLFRRPWAFLRRATGL